MSENLIRSSAVMAVGTLISRVTGFIRNLVIVALLGTTLLGDTYNVGNTMPNIIYNLIIGGALTAVFLPQIVRAGKDSDGGSGFISKLVTLVMLALIVLTIIAMLIAPFFLQLYAPTFTGREADLALIFTWFCLPQIIFYGLYAILGQIANSRSIFGPMMWTPILNNLVVIALFTSFLLLHDEISLATITDEQVRLLGAGTTLGIIIQALALIPTIRRLRIRLRLDFNFRESGLGKSIRLAGWTFLYALITQLGFAVTVNLGTRITKEASLLGLDSGLGFTPYQNAYLIFLLPHSIFAISIATALLPDLTRSVQENDLDSVREKLIRSLRLCGIALIPSSLFFLIFGEKIGEVIFFGIPTSDAQFIGRALSAFSLALVPLGLNMIFTRALNAFENTKYQALSNLIINSIASLLAILAYLFLPIETKTIGMAGSFAISYFIGAFITYLLLRRYLHHLPHRRYLTLYGQLAAISLIPLLPLAIIVAAFSETFERMQIGNTLQLLVVLVIVIPSYLLIARKVVKSSGGDEVGEVMALITSGRTRK